MLLFHRRQSIPVQVGSVTIGGDAPIVVQSMTNTDTENARATAEQIIELAKAGSEIVRLTVNTLKAAENVARIRDILLARDCSVPLVGDFHYNGHQLLEQSPSCAKALDKYRINPGNVGFGKKRESQFALMIEKAIEHQKPVRIGVNWGSLDEALLTELMDANAKSAAPKEAQYVMHEAIIQSALRSGAEAERIGLPANKIILSCKMSRVQDLIAVYSELAGRCSYPLHLGLTEAGLQSKGIVATTAALSILLQQGIGDTIRASLTPDPNGDRTLEVRVCQEILQSLDLRSFMPMVTACPGCGRTTSTYFQELASKIQQYLREKMPEWKQQYPGVETLQVAVMGCVVNGPGESKHADLGISLPGSGEDPVAPVFKDGKKFRTLRGDRIAEEFQEIVEKYIAEKYAAATSESVR